MLKKYFSLTVLALFILLSFSCEEVAPVLNPGGDGPGEDVPVEDQMRQVLIEEFTGVRCVNCPAGSEAIEVLLNTYGQQLVAVSIHAGFFAVPYPESDGELETAAGSSILSLLGEPLGFPTAVVNRKRFDGEENRQIGQSSWPGYIAQELVGNPAVKIDIIPAYNEATRELAVDVDLYVEENVAADDLRLTVFITESNIKDPQLTPAGTDLEYTHKHAFRTAITAFDGNTLSDTFTAGAVVSRSFNTTLPTLWNANECHVVAFVHQGGSTLDVIQAHQVDVVE